LDQLAGAWDTRLQYVTLRCLCTGTIECGLHSIVDWKAGTISTQTIAAERRPINPEQVGCREKIGAMGRIECQPKQ
jgi:hypothetical protein